MLRDKKSLLLLLFSLLLLISSIGCPTPEAYVKSTEIGLINAKSLDKNIDIFALNYYTFVKKDTLRFIANGEMTVEVQKKVLDNVAKQMANLKEQSVINLKFVILAHDQAHDEGLDVTDVLVAIKTVNETIPEVKSLIDNLKGKGD